MRFLTLWLIAVSTAIAQRPQSPDASANLPAQRIGVDDLLSVTVYGAPELSRTVRVASDGRIGLPMLKEKIAARGAMPAELEMRLAEALASADLLVEPVVTVNIAEYASRPLSIVGAVRHPQTFEVKHPVSLLDALARAEGLSAEAGKEILVTRPSPIPGGQPWIERIAAAELIGAANPSANVMLQGGEEVRVPEAGRVFVVGNVKRPGTFRMEETVPMTVMTALALSEGLSPFSAKEAYIYRMGEGSQKHEIAVALRKILDRKAPDVALEAKDILYIPDN